MIEIFAIDPGPDKSGFVVGPCAGGIMREIVANGYTENATVRALLSERLAALRSSPFVLTCEFMGSSFGVAGAAKFRTCAEVGRFEQIAIGQGLPINLIVRVDRRIVQDHLHARKDPIVDKRLLARYGAAAGALAEVRNQHARQALAVACVLSEALDLDQERVIGPLAGIVRARPYELTRDDLRGNGA